MNQQFQFQIVEVYQFYLKQSGRLENLFLMEFILRWPIIRFFEYIRHCLLNPIRSSFNVSEDSERKDSVELIMLRSIRSQEDSSALFLESTFLFFFHSPLFLFLTLIDSLESVFIPTISNCQSNFGNSYQKFSCNFFIL